MTLLVVDATNAVARRAATKPELDPAIIAMDALDRTLIAARWLKCSHVIACFDFGTSWRSAVLPEYKAGSVGVAQHYSEAAFEVWKSRVCSVVVPDCEADDLCATLVARSTRAVYTLSSDNDFMQLAGRAHVMQYAPKDAPVWLVERTSEYVREKYGVRPDQYPAYLALVGGKSGVAGVPSVGAKRAATLLTEHDTLLKACDVVPLLSTHREHALAAERVHTLKTDAPIPPILPSACLVP
jgi:DNA polymerase-1